MAKQTPPGVPPAGFQDQTVLEPPTSGGLPAFLSGEAEEGIRPTPWQSWVESLKEESLDSPIGFFPGFEGALARGHVQHQIEEQFRRENRSKISADEANRRYPGLPKPFAESIYPEVADLIASDNRRRQDLRAWIGRGEMTGFYDTLSGVIAGGVAGSLGGPFGVAAGAVGGGIAGSVFGGSSVVGGVADPANLALMIATGGISRALGAANTVRNSFLQNLAGNLVTSGLTVPQRIKERQDVSLAQEAVSVVGGAAGGTVLEVAMGAAARGLRAVFGRAEAFASRSSVATQERNLRAAVAQHEAGARIDVTPATRELELRTAGALEPGVGGAPYVFRPGEAPSSRVYYAARHADTGEAIPFGDFGEVGLHAVDNSRSANNLASAPESELTGRIQEVRVPEDAKLLDLEKPVTDPASAQFISALERQMGVKLDLPEGATVGDALREIRHEIVFGDLPRPAVRVAADVAQGMGFDGYQYVNRVGNSEHNGIVLFDEKRALPGQEFTANKDITPRMNPEEQQQLSDFDQTPDRSAVYEPDLDEKVNTLTSQEPANSQPDYMDPILQQQELEARNYLKELAVDDESVNQEIQGLTRQAARDKQELQAMKDYTTCLTGGMV